MKQLRVLVVDDSSLFRALIADCVNNLGFARVVAHARDGREAIAKHAEYAPDAVTLDLEMPGISGLEALRAIKASRPSTAVFVVSSFTPKGAKATLEALTAGAHDVLAKPAGGDLAKSRAELRESLGALLQALLLPPALLSVPSARAKVRVGVPKIVGIGSSTGGPAALGKIVPMLPGSLPVPVVIAQHMPPMFTASLAEALAEKSALRVVEARHGEPLEAGTAYIAPGGKHLKVASAGGAERHLELTDDPPENYCRPAVDYLFRSIAELYREEAMGVILTGMGKDGTAGLKAMRRHPVHVIGQCAESCAVYGMPREARLAGCVDEELPAERIAEAIVARLPGAGARLAAAAR
jgi:two-component system chemotaxis response regulator CheB